MNHRPKCAHRGKPCSYYSSRCRSCVDGLRPSLTERFWSRVDKRGPNECWLWKAGRTPCGYGRISVGAHRNHHNAPSHRIAWEMTNGLIPVGLCVCHRCDVKLCCNPAHLFLGTLTDNNADRDRKGRARFLYGEDHHHHKLTWVAVREMRQMAESGLYTRRQLGEMFGVPQSSATKIVLGQQWKEKTERNGNVTVESVRS